MEICKKKGREEKRICGEIKVEEETKRKKMEIAEPEPPCEGDESSTEYQSD